jgi:hypothetical protein
MAEGTLVITISNQVTAPAVVAGTFITGWHVPTDVEWDTLVITLGGYAIAGGKLKEMGFTHWDPPNTGATNEVGFNGRGSGERLADGTFSTLKIAGSYRSSTSGSFSYCTLSNSDAIVLSPDAIDPKGGYAIRLIKNDSVNPGSVLDYDGYLYGAIKIGTQVWMDSNLRTTHWADGTPIPIVTDNAAWAALTTAGMCYYNNTP